MTTPRAVSGLECWVLTDGTIGMEVQGVGLARAIGIEPIVETIRPNPVLRLMPGLGRIPLVAPAVSGGDPLTPPWPDLVISCGRRTAGASIAIRARSRRKSFTVHIQDPRISPSAFDVLVVPDHDPAKGPGVIRTVGALNRLTKEGVAEAAGELDRRLPHLPYPRVAVNIGGSNKRYDFSEAQVERFAQALNEMAERDGAGLIIATSRRTDARTKDILARVLTGPNVWLWRGPDDGPNPYPGCLGLADAIVVTSDSVNMVSEACWTGKPVLVSAIEPESGRLARFHEQLRERGMTRVFQGRLERWDYTPLDETARVAEAIRPMLENR